MDKNEYFINLKNKALNKLNSAMNENKVDKRIKKIINLINSNEYFYTSSSCAGRIVIIELPELGDKIKAKFKDGVLEVEIPEPEEEKPKQITVDVE